MPLQYENNLIASRPSVPSWSRLPLPGFSPVLLWTPGRKINRYDKLRCPRVCCSFASPGGIPGACMKNRKKSPLNTATGGLGPGATVLLTGGPRAAGSRTPTKFLSCLHREPHALAVVAARRGSTCAEWHRKCTVGQKNGTCSRDKTTA